MSIKINNRIIAGSTLSYAGSFDYSATTTYKLYDIVKDPSSTILYYSTRNGNLGNPLTDINYWQELKLGGSGLQPIVTTVLPEEGDSTKIYFVPNDQPTEEDSYNEYIWDEVNERFELVGSTRVDLSNYPTFDDMNQAINEAVSVKADTDEMELELSKKANIVDLTRIPTGLLHSYYERRVSYSPYILKCLKITPGHVLNAAGDELFKTTSDMIIRMDTVQYCISNRTILGTTTRREDLLDYDDSYFEGTTSTGTIVPVESLGNFEEFGTGGTINNLGEGYRYARDAFGEGSALSQSGGFVFDMPQPLGNYVVSLASDNIIEAIRVGFYRLVNKEQQADGSYNYEVELVSQQHIVAENPSTLLSFSATCNGAFDLMAVATDVPYTRYIRMYYVAVSNTYGTYLVKTGDNSYTVKLALDPQALVDATYTNYARIGTVTISDGPVWYYPTEDVGTSFANGDFAPQEVDYSNFYSRKEMDALLYGKANKADTLAGYGIRDAYTIEAINQMMNRKQNKLTPGTNIQIVGDVISTTFHDVYGSDEVDELLSHKADWGTTLSDYRIDNAYTKDEVTSLLNYKQNSNDDALLTTSKTVVGSINELLQLANMKANLATTLAGYGIQDAYTKDEVNTKIAEAAEAGGANVDEVTITRAEDTKQISTIGVRTKSNVLKYDWVGTSEAWTQGRTSGTIADDWWCYITDDGKSYVEDENAQSYATVDYVDEMVDLAKTELQTALDEYSTATNTRLSALELTDTRFETRIAAIETAMSERIDRINGEVID